VEQPLAVVEQPLAVVEQPLAVVEQPLAVVEQPLAVVDFFVNEIVHPFPKELSPNPSVSPSNVTVIDLKKQSVQTKTKWTVPSPKLYIFPADQSPNIIEGNKEDKDIIFRILCELFSRNITGDSVSAVKEKVSKEFYSKYAEYIHQQIEEFKKQDEISKVIKRSKIQKRFEKKIKTRNIAIYT